MADPAGTAGAALVGRGLRAGSQFDHRDGRRARTCPGRADEPTSALDVSVQATVLALFRELQQRLGFAALFISHDLAVVDSLAHRIGVLYRGELV